MYYLVILPCLLKLTCVCVKNIDRNINITFEDPHWYNAYNRGLNLILTCPHKDKKPVRTGIMDEGLHVGNYDKLEQLFANTSIFTSQ